jgi:hypothetical protein
MVLVSVDSALQGFGGEMKNTVAKAAVIFLTLGSVAHAQSGPYDWTGPYPFGLTETEIDGVIDHFYLIENPLGNPALGVTLEERQFVKFQLTGPTFECWKYVGLCEAYGETKAGQFLAEFITLIRKLPAKAVFDDKMDDLLAEYEDPAVVPGGYSLDAAEQALRDDIITYYPNITWSDYLFNGVVAPDNNSPSGSVELRQGRARYVFGGHNWAKAVAVPINGSSVSISADFRNLEPDDFTVNRAASKNRTKVNRALVTGPYANGFWIGHDFFRTVSVTVFGNGDSVVGSACFRGGNLGFTQGCMGVIP